MQINNKLAIWVPLSHKTGLGHFYRMLGIYEQVPNSFFFFNTPHLSLKERHKFIDSEEPGEILLFLQKEGVKTLLIDHYFLPSNIISYIIKKAALYSIKTVYFDRTLENRKFNAILNNNPYVSHRDIKVPDGKTKYFLGSEYYIFRKDIKKIKNLKKTKNCVFICFGGSDVRGLTYTVLSFLDRTLSYEIILGKGCDQAYVDKVFYQIKNLNLKVNLHHNPDNYFEIMSKSSFALISSSTVFYECSYYNLPVICIKTAENQNHLINFLKQNEIIVLMRDEEIEKLTDLINKKSFRMTSISFEEKSQELISYLI